MFKKLKEKITEEVKSSPQRFQQLTQSVSDKLQSSTTSDDNFFSIGDDDANMSSVSNDQGFSSVTLVSPTAENKMRRHSNSSIASDVSFLPRYEASNMYHLQSDLDVSASELEDNASTSSQAGHLSKEQIYAAYQKTLRHYHKYRGRYTDLARHYKELERENAKMKSVLVETQDKAIRRVTELKEQCCLEQKAKAHLESALRDELDEKHIKIQTLQTKINLLQGDNSAYSSDRQNKVDSEKFETLTKYLNDARSEIETLNSKVQEYKANTIVFQSKEQEYKTKITSLEKDIAGFWDREKENNIKLAENKMELHNELVSKDADISRLKKELEVTKTQVESYEKEGSKKTATKIENLQIQNNKLIEKVENLTKKCNELENELLKVETYKLEIKELNDRNLTLCKSLDESKELKDKFSSLTEVNFQLQSVIESLKVGLGNCQENLKALTEEKNSLIKTISREKEVYESQIDKLRNSAKKGLFTLEKQILDRVKKDYEEREAQLREELIQKVEDISSNNSGVKEMHLKLIENDSYIKKLTEDLTGVHEKLLQKDIQYKELENNHLEVIEESSKLRNTIVNLEKQLALIRSEDVKAYEEKIARLQASIKTLQDEIEHLNKISDRKEDDNVHLAQDIFKLDKSNTELYQKVRLDEERVETGELEITESNLLEMKLQALEKEKQYLMESFEMERKMFNDILKENKEMKVNEIYIGELNDRNQKLEEKILRLKGYLKNKEDSIVHLNKIKLELEQDTSKLKQILRLADEKDECIELDQTECNLLQIKVQQLEIEKENLIKSFEKERDEFDYSFHKQSDVSSAQREETIEENVMLAKENLELKKINDELMAKVRLVEEKDETIELEVCEGKMLKLKLDQLEKERSGLLEEFEMEREMFNKILVEHKDLKLKEQCISALEDSNKHLTEKIAELKGYLHKKDEVVVELSKIKLELEEEVSKLKQLLMINEERTESLAMDKTECGLLEMKVQALEEEKKRIMQSFELESGIYEDVLRKSAHDKNLVEELTSENLLLKEEKEKLNGELKKEREREKELVNRVRKLNEDVEKLEKENESLRKELEEREQQIKELSQATIKLSSDIEKQSRDFNGVLERSKKLEVVLGKMQNESTESRNSEEELRKKVEEVQLELDKKKLEIVEMRKALEDVDKRYNLEKDRQEEEISRLHGVASDERKKFNDLENVKLKLERELKKRMDEYNFKSKEISVMEQQFAALRQDKDGLLLEVRQLKQNIEELTQENASLQHLIPKVRDLEQVRKQNEVLQKECDKLNQEISELKVRINQIYSDNRHITEEHERLITEVEGYKAKNEFLENEKGQFHQKTGKLEGERDSLQVMVTELNKKLGQNSKDLESMTGKRASISTNDLDLVKIQADFFEIKEKCDSLFVENKNLKAEYTKLEEQCNNFSKIKKDLENQMSELERHYNEVLHEKQLLQDEVQELKISPICTNSTSTNKLDNLAIAKQEKDLNGPSTTDSERVQTEIENLRDKLMQYKSLDITNKSSIEFYENELQKIKNKNEKLNRKLDETLVTLNHCTELSSSTEVEYLKNVLYNYMLGKESMVLARVIAAVCKFDPGQTEAVLQKEQQKQTLLGQLGLL